MTIEHKTKSADHRQFTEESIPAFQPGPTSRFDVHNMRMLSVTHRLHIEGEPSPNWGSLSVRLNLTDNEAKGVYPPVLDPIKCNGLTVYEGLPGAVGRFNIEVAHSSTQAFLNLYMTAKKHGG